MFNSHEVRRLRVCCLCQKLGIYRPTDPATAELEIVVCLHPDSVPKKERKYAHPRCYQQEMGIGKLLALPHAELDSIRLCDVSARTMRSILKHRKDESRELPKNEISGQESLPRPSGPFPWASEEELEALYAGQAGQI